MTPITQYALHRYALLRRALRERRARLSARHALRARERL